LGILKAPLIISTFKPFFVDLNLPISAQTDELVNVQVVVHNYFDEQARVKVEIDGEDNNYEIISNGRKFNEYDEYDDDHELRVET
jgi:hypothetical protein